MYEACFGFQERPFRENSELKSYFPAESIEQARLALTRVIDRGSGAGLLIGPAGTGKTLICRMLAEQAGQDFDVLSLSCGRLRSGRALLQNLLFALRLPHRDMSEGDLRLSLIERLTRRSDSRRGALLIFDEAHVLPLRLLDEIRLLMNLTRAGEPCIRLILAGAPSLEERFANPKLESFSQRLAARCYLRYLAAAETAGYVRHQLAVAGVRPESLVDDSTLRAIHVATDGIPRLINQVCDHALLIASATQRHRLSAALVEDAWADLQQLPLPWKQVPAAEATSVTGPSIVEFGQLTSNSPTEVSLSDETEFDDATSSLVERRVIEIPLPRVNGTRNDSPTAELPAAENPFSDEFIEEEVVVCRYSSMESERAHRRPQVVSAEGRELAELIRAWDAHHAEIDSRFAPVAFPIQETAEHIRHELQLVGDLDDVVEHSSRDDAASRPTLAVLTDSTELESPLEPPASGNVLTEPAPLASFVWVPEPQREPIAEVFWAYDGSGEGLALLPSSADVVVPGVVEAPEVSPDIEPESELVRVQLQEELLPEDCLAPSAMSKVVDLIPGADDRDIIVIEDDDARTFRSATASPVERPKHRQYRQLFARLRQG